MIPVSRDQLIRWSPPSLANAPAPPVFIFRPATWALRRRWQEICSEQNLVYPTDEALNGEFRRALKALWSEEDHERELPKLEQALLDLKAGTLVGEALEAFIELEQGVVASWPRYARLATQRNSFIRYAPYAALSLLLAGWENLDTTFKRESGEVSFDTIEALERELTLLEEDLKAKGIEGIEVPGLAWLVLANEAINSMNLNGAQRKNSSPESQSDGTLEASSPGGTATPAGEASETSTEEAKSGSGSKPARSPSRKTSAKRR